MSNYLMVPIRLDALYVQSEKTVVEQMADFSTLPFFNGQADFNPDTANISESIVSQPFQNENLRLGAGIHLHWALPDALTQGKDTDQGLVFPSVPNRWLVTRSKKNASNQWDVEKQWIVESDYLYLEGIDKNGVSISIPYRLKETGAHQTYRYLGRKMPLKAWESNLSGAEYLRPLTAVGYGNPHFAAFYPNCHSVFGMHDPVTESIAQFSSFRYEVIGWYSDIGQDELAKFSATLTQDFKEAIKGQFQWEMDIDQNPDATLCYARLDFSPSSDTENTDKNAADTIITVANSGTESLSAHLSQLIDNDYRVFIENQLEAFQVNHQLEQNQVDTIARLKAIRHEKEFHSEESGIHWEINAQSHTPPSAEKKVDTTVQINLLPDSVATTLNEVNTLQRAYDLTRHEIESLRKQLFADWYKYMLCCYPSDRAENDYPDIDLVKTFIEEKVLKVLQDKVAILGALSFQKNDLTEQIIAATTTSSTDTKAGQLATKINQLLDETRNGLSLDLRCDQIINSQTPDAVMNRNGTIQGSPELVSDEIFGSCLSFDGSSDYVQVADNDAIDFARDEDFTVQTWIKVAPIQADTRNSDNNVIEKWNGSGGYPYVIRYLNSGSDEGKVCVLRYNGSSAASIHSTKTINDNQFHHIAFVKNGDSLYLYIDGEEDGSTSDLSSGDTKNSSPLYLGCRGGNENFFKGNIAHLRIYSRALSTDEIKKIMSPAVPSYSLREVAGPRYWQPNDPVVLINGDAAKATRRHGHDGVLSCKLYTTASTSLSKNDFASLLVEVNNLYTNDANGWGFQTWERQPWNPYLLEWQARFFPTRTKSNLHLRTGQYDPAFVTDNYEARFNNPDLSIKSDKAPVINKVANTYTNRSILTPYTKQYLSESMETFLAQKILDDYFAEHVDETADDFLSKDTGNIDNLKTWYENRASFSSKSREEKAKDAIYTAIRAYKQLQALHCLSQSLGGFNEALLMHRQTLELPINDPLAFDDYQPFTQSQVNTAIATSRKIAPSPLNDFNPIRSGCLRVTRLRLVDTFGQVKTLSTENINTTVKMTTPESKRLVYLPPRLSQPARIHFRWLNAEEQIQEMNTHYKTRPICGWVAPNYFDRSLMVYDAQGKPLGAINPNADWEAPPGAISPDLVENIANPHLRKMVAYLRNTGKSNTAFLNNFMNALESALENIEPASYQENKSMALMMGRPIALVRAALNIELQGLPAVNHDWSVLRRDMNAHNREHDNFTKVKFPVRLGEYRQLNDGLVGYWIESEERYFNETFYAPQADRPDSTNIDAYLDRNPINFYQSIDEAPQTFSILIDVQGVAHATAGILPSKAIAIPPEQYKQALQDIEVTFLTAPILTERNKVNLSLAPQQGYDWHWVSKKDDAFWDEELSTVPTLKQSVFIEQSSHGDATSLWDYLIQVKWLESVDTERAIVVSKDQRSSATLEDPFAGLDEEVETIFDVCAEYIRSASTEASFGSISQIREGWVKLSKPEETNVSSS